jgi:hypothetical protein
MADRYPEIVLWLSHHDRRVDALKHNIHALKIGKTPACTPTTGLEPASVQQLVRKQYVDCSAVGKVGFAMESHVQWSRHASGFYFWVLGVFSVRVEETVEFGVLLRAKQ